MAQRAWPIPIVLTWLLGAAGCAVLPDASTSASLAKRQQPLPAGTESQVVQVDVFSLERPAGDAFLNQELWQHTDEMIVDLDRKAAVEDNGFRVGHLIGITPGKLQDLLESKRYCFNKRRHLLPSGNSVTLYRGAVWPRGEFLVQEGLETLEETLEQARFCLDVRATLTGDGKTRLSFSPKVEHGGSAIPFEAVPDQQAWTIRVDKPCRAYHNVTWDVVLAPGEYLIIGAIPQKGNSLGHRSFIQEEGAPSQRLLVLRTSRAPQSGGTDAPATEDSAHRTLSPCLAVQASRNAVRTGEE